MCVKLSFGQGFFGDMNFMGKKNNNALIVFARDPIVGQVKTRLNPFLDLQTVCDLYTCLLSDSIDKACSVKCADCFIGVYPSSNSGYFERLDPSLLINIFIQEGKDLGERMKNAFSARFAEGYEHVAIIGADSPSLPLAYLKQAFSSEREVVLGPSVDGGYYLIGMRGKLVNLFEGIKWGESSVLKDTSFKLKASRASMELLPVWYDVDRIDDLKFLKTHLELLADSDQKEGAATQKFLSGMSF